MATTPDRRRHPCFNKDVSGECGRIHLPVAPKCNVMCNYCNRKYDCMNESRPGVTSAVLSPSQAANYLDQVLEKEPRITVVGIAGPGDPFANAQETLETIRLIRERHPEMLVCLSSNGLGVPPYLDAIAELGVTHMTITVNAVDPEVGKHFYRWVRDGKFVFRGLDAARLMLERQTAAIKGLKERGITVKVNTIVVPGFNDEHIEEIAKTMSGMGVDILNLIPLYPVAETGFQDVPEPGKERIRELQAAAEKYLPQMRHCKRCRADAVGLLSNDRSGEFAGCLSACASATDPAVVRRPYVAVATMEGLLVNKHLGEAEKFQIWEQKDGGFSLREERWAPEPGTGRKRWEDLAGILHDCRAVLVSGVGSTPQEILEEKGVMALELEGFITEALKVVYGSGNLAGLKRRKTKSCCSVGAMGCTGTGEGCG